MSKQTAVDYLVKELGDILDARFIKPMQDLLIVNAVNKAKKLEREQIEDAYNASLLSNTRTFEHYWEQIYGGNNESN